MYWLASTKRRALGKFNHNGGLDATGIMSAYATGHESWKANVLGGRLKICKACLAIVIAVAGGCKMCTR